MANYAEYINRDDALSKSTTRRISVATGVTVNNRDFVYFDGTTGRVTAAAPAGKLLQGMVMGGQAPITGRSQRVSGGALTATGVADGSAKVLVCIEPQARYLLKANAALTEAKVGLRYDLTGAAGSQLINSTAAAAGAFELLHLGNGIRGTDNTFGVFRLVTR